MVTIDESTQELLDELNIESENMGSGLRLLEEANNRYIRDLKVNLKNVIVSEHLSEKEAALVGLSIAVNNKNEVLKNYFLKLSEKAGCTNGEISEAVACASLLAANNVFYRFRHFMGKAKYNELPGRIKMNIMMKPVLGKEFFELMSLAVSAVNGCEMCVKAHEASLIQLGASEERIFDAVRLAAVVSSLDRLV